MEESASRIIRLSAGINNVIDWLEIEGLNTVNGLLIISEEIKIVLGEKNNDNTVMAKMRNIIFYLPLHINQIYSFGCDKSNL